MTCREFEAALHPYVDGELPVREMTEAEGHAAQCARCHAMARDEREFRRLLRRQPREAVPEALRDSIRSSLRRSVRSRILRPILIVPALTATAAAIVIVLLAPVFRATPPSLVAELIDKHIAYAQIERPAELASSDAAEVAEWFRARASLRVIVPDYSGAGIRLAGARITDAGDRKAAYLLYEKGHTLLSVFMVRSDLAEPVGPRVAYRGHEYTTTERKGIRTVAWTEGQSLFSLVSSLDYEALLECADRLRIERARQTRI